MLSDRFVIDFEVYHLGGADGDNTRDYSVSADITSKGLLLPAQPEDIALLEGAFSEVSIFLVPIMAIKKDDKILIGSDEYRVGGFRTYDGFGNNQPHLRLTIFKPNK